MPETELQEKLTAAETRVTELEEQATLTEAEKEELSNLREKARTGEAHTIVTEALKDIEMPEEAKSRAVVEAMKDLPVTDGTLNVEALKEKALAAATVETEYLEKAMGTGRVSGLGVGGDVEDGKKKLEESWRRMHPNWSDEQIRIAVTGR